LFLFKSCNNWRRSLTETFFIKFFNLFYVRSCPSSQFFNFLRSFMLRGLDWESLLILQTLWYLCWPESSGNDYFYILSKNIWSLKDQNIKYDIKWRIVKQARSYSNVTKRCNLCLWEKFFILCKLEMSTLNSRNELASCCRHARKFLLKNVII